MFPLAHPVRTGEASERPPPGSTAGSACGPLGCRSGHAARDIGASAATPAAARGVWTGSRTTPGNGLKGEGMASGIGSWGVYLPFWRLERKAIAARARADRRVGAPGRSPPTTRTPPPWAWKRPGGPWPVPGGWSADQLFFSTTWTRPTRTRPTPPPSTPPWAWPSDGLGARHGGLGPLGGRRAPRRGRYRRRPPRPWPSLADIRTGLPGGADERDSAATARRPSAASPTGPSPS